MINQFIEWIENASDQEIKEILLVIAKRFYIKGLGNPFNYNRGMEFIQALTFGLILCPVGGGSDAYHALQAWYAELKKTSFLGFTKAGILKSHSFAYNGTTRKPTLDGQIEYCRTKILRDKYHFLTIVDDVRGALYQTFKVPGEEMSKVLLPKMIHSWETGTSKGDPRINASVSTNDIMKSGIYYETIEH